jgi:hypothetical protein
MNIYHLLLIVHPLMDKTLVFFANTLILSTKFMPILLIIEHDDYTTYM